jgi:hypothetical protein
MKSIWKTGKITTIAGLIVVGVGVWLYISPNHNAIEAGAVAGIGLLFLKSEDSLLSLKQKK